jgi:hypothetical protein
MVLIDNEFKLVLVEKINQILTMENNEWQKMDKKIKLKYIHRLCSYIENDKIDNFESITIPLKSIKPKKMIQYCGISNLQNKNLYLQYNKLILDYTRDFRNKYINIPKRQFYTYNSLIKQDYDNILNEYNKIIYTFINKNKIDIKNLLKFTVGANFDKIIFDHSNSLEYKINYSENFINFTVGNFIITFTLSYTGNNITNNIPVKYYVKLINNI